MIVNAAAHTAVDKGGERAEFAELLNATSVAAIAKEAGSIACLVGALPTDYVSMAAVSAPAETDATALLNVYGETKPG